jgi:hypothetical protein
LGARPPLSPFGRLFKRQKSADRGRKNEALKSSKKAARSTNTYNTFNVDNEQEKDDIETNLSKERATLLPKKGQNDKNELKTRGEHCQRWFQRWTQGSVDAREVGHKGGWRQGGHENVLGGHESVLMGHESVLLPYET